MNTYIFIGWEAPPLEAIPIGCWAEYQPDAYANECYSCFSIGRWFMVYPP